MPRGSSWSSLFDTYPRGRSHSAPEKARWYADVTHREDLLPQQRNWARGHWFNYATADQHRATEVTLHRLDARGNVTSWVRLDALGENEVISKKNVQLWDASPEAWKRNINEIPAKYKPDQPNLVVAPTKGTYDKVDRGELDEEEIGESLQGQMVLGVPPQQQPIPQEILDYAAERGVIIKEYEPHPDAGEPE